MNPKYERLENEDLYEYGLRLIEIKIEQKPDDLDWEDIVEATNLGIHRDSLRKAASTTPYSGYAVMKYFQKKFACEDSPKANDYMDEIELKITQMRKEAKKYYDQRREFNKIVDKIGREENLEDRLVEAANRLNEVMPLKCNKCNDVYEDNEAIIVLADWHYGMCTENIWEHYDTDICRERVEKLVDKAKKKLLLHNSRKLHVVIMGDMAHGAIHTNTRVASNELTCEQIMHVSEILAQAISQLADMVDETVIHATYGNHLRTIQKKEDSIHADNMERLIPWWLEQRFKCRTDISIPNAEYYEFLCFDANGHTICATHGDLDNIKNAGNIIATLFNKKYGKNIEYVILADKHHLEEFEELGIEAMIVRSLCGTDEYANGKRLYSTPGQLLMTFNEDGRDASYQIRV